MLVLKVDEFDNCIVYIVKGRGVFDIPKTLEYIGIPKKKFEYKNIRTSCVYGEGDKYFATVFVPSEFFNKDG